MTALVLSTGVEIASAATLRAEYRFRDSLASEVAGAPALANIGAGNRFAFERVDGLGRHRVLRFPEGNGLSLATRGLVNPTNNSVVVVFRFAETEGYRRILDFTEGTADTGLYNLNGKLEIYGAHASSEGIVFGAGTYTQVALTTAAAAEGSEQATAYVNGVQVAAGNVPSGLDLRPGVLRFFRDNTRGSFPGEESSGAVSCVLVYDGTLSADEVALIARDPTLCPAPRPAPGRVKASVTGRPEARRARRAIVVDTGLTVSCPIGATSCRASGRVVSAEGPSRGKRLGTVGFTVRAGEGRNIELRLPGRGARVLRNAGTMKVEVSAEIRIPGGRTAKAHQTGTLTAPRLPAFSPGTYTGVTDQNLPIILTVGETGVRSAFFRWRAGCDDGKTRTNVTVLRGRAKVRHGHFELSAQLDSGGSARVSGRLKGVHASGTLVRTGPIRSGARCTVGSVAWHARVTKIEGGSSSG